MWPSDEEKVPQTPSDLPSFLLAFGSTSQKVQTFILVCWCLCCDFCLCFFSFSALCAAKTSGPNVRSDPSETSCLPSDEAPPTAPHRFTLLPAGGVCVIQPPRPIG